MAAGGTMFCSRCVLEVVLSVLYVFVYVLMAIYVCCKYMFHVFQTYVSRVLSVCFMCFILMLQKDLMLHMLQRLDTYFQVYVPHVSSVLNVCSKCFSCFRRMFHVFHLDVAITIQVCFHSILHMLQRSNGCCRGDETLG
jgi:hypothetical protein